MIASSQAPVAPPTTATASAFVFFCAPAAQAQGVHAQGQAWRYRACPLHGEGYRVVASLLVSAPMPLHGKIRTCHSVTGRAAAVCSNATTMGSQKNDSYHRS